MANVKLPPVPDDNASIKDLIDHIAMLHKTINNILNNLGSENMFEIGGFEVKGDQLASNDGDVGLSTNDDNAVGSNIRIWAGGLPKETAAFRVYDDGSISMEDGTLTGFIINGVTINGGTINGTEINGGTINTTGDVHVGNTLTVGDTDPSVQKALFFGATDFAFYTGYPSFSSTFNKALILAGDVSDEFRIGPKVKFLNGATGVVAVFG